jgi:hypothetical protein
MGGRQVASLRTIPRSTPEIEFLTADLRLVLRKVVGDPVGSIEIPLPQPPGVQAKNAVKPN